MIDTFKYNGSIGLNKNTDLLRKAGLNGSLSDEELDKLYKVVVKCNTIDANFELVYEKARQIIKDGIARELKDIEDKVINTVDRNELRKIKLFSRVKFDNTIVLPDTKGKRMLFLRIESEVTMMTKYGMYSTKKLYNIGSGIEIGIDGIKITDAKDENVKVMNIVDNNKSEDLYDLDRFLIHQYVMAKAIAESVTSLKIHRKADTLREINKVGRLFSLNSNEIDDVNGMISYMIKDWAENYR